MTAPEQIIALYQMIRERIPAAVLRTTDARLPGRRGEEFSKLLTFLEQYPFERVGAFQFSPEKRTRAYNQGPRVKAEVARGRLHEIMVRQKQRSRLFNRGLLGKKLEIMVDYCNREKKMLHGRFFGQAPEVDGKVYLPNTQGTPGELVQARITGSGAYDLIGEKL